MISLIVPVYNVEKYLPKCIESIINQIYNKWELLLINDGSTDNSAAVCKEYQSRDTRIRYYEKPNGGLSDARNHGIDRANGEFLAFIDSDDYISTCYLNTMYQKMRLSCTDICICNLLKIFEEGSIDSGNESNEDLPIIGDNLNAIDILAVVASSAANKYKYLTVVNKLYRTNIFAELRFAFGKLHEDEFIFHKIFSQQLKVSCINDTLYYYLIRSGSITQAKYSPKRLDCLEALTERLELYDEKKWYSFFPATVRQCVSVICEAKDLLDITEANSRDKWRYAKQTFNGLSKYAFRCSPKFPITLLYLLTYISPSLVLYIKKRFFSSRIYYVNR